MTDLRQALEEARRALLDLSTRNRLLALPKAGRSRGVVILDDEDADFVQAALANGRAFGFEAAGAETPDPPPADAEGKPKRTRKRTTKAAAKAEGVARADDSTTREEWQRDALLRVRLPPPDLARRLRDLMTDARTAREETGIPTLYLALGVLSWRDPATPGTERRAPLALLPVTLEREGVSQTFRLRAGATEVAENLSLREMLKVNFGTSLPAFSDADYNPTAWAEAVAAAVKDRPDWSVDADALALGLFSFAKFLMWRDLGPEENPGLADHPLVQALVGGAALSTQPTFPDDADVDEAVPVEQLDHVVDMDGSQALAAESVRRGGHVVIQGPPGTGKSQTIATILAQAVLDLVAERSRPGQADERERLPGAAIPGTAGFAQAAVLASQGWTVRPVRALFVAEKLAALEVVKRRLENIGLGAACLELHSEKQSKRAVLDELRATLALPPPTAKADRADVVRRLADVRGRLNRHAAAMRGPAGASGIPLHQVIGALVGLRRRAVPVPDFTLDVAAWDGATIAARRSALRDLAARATEADGANNPWRGVMADLGPADADRLMARLPGWIRAFAAAGAASGGTGGPAALAARQRAAAALREAPAHDTSAMASAAWRADPAPLVALTEAVAQLAIAKRDPRLKPGALDVAGLEEARAGLAASGGFFGFLNSAKRAAQEVAARVARDGADPLAALEAAITGQGARARVRSGSALGAAAFGRLWKGEDTDPSVMSTLILWRQKHGPEAAAALAAEAPAGDPGVLDAAATAWAELKAATALDPRAAFGTADPPFAALAERLAAWAEAPDALPPWQGWRHALAAAQDLAPVVERLQDGRLAPEAAEDAFAYALHEGLLRAAAARHPDLAAFDAAAYDRLVTEFREADRARIALTRAEAARAHAERVRQVRDGAPGMTVIRGEMEKKRGHLPVRELLLRAAPAVQAAKPIFMMSPLSVAQFLSPPHGLRPGPSFDLLVIDEASQVEPVDALGAIARCRQVVVVGDDRQMPPTRFFQRMTEEAEDTPPEDAPDAVAARDVESILGLCNARGVPAAMLRWHYRSRHESLIATSNQEFYDNRLLVLPSPRPRSPALGLSLVRVDGAWETGEGTNRAEAAAVAEAVMRHARETPKDTLGVAAFSIRQRDAIMDAIEAARRADPSADAFFADHADEPFFVKNLENVQGDERDAILISVGYGRDKDGRLAMRFGPLSAEGGERRLNVLITRAKKRCVVFAGIGADDIDTERASGRGVAALRTFLAFAAGPAAAPRAGGQATDGPRASGATDAPRASGATGGPRASGATGGPRASGATDGPRASGATGALAEAIADAVTAAGREPVPRVGLAGLFLDIAARGETGYELGIEADAGDWAALRCARDRERGRPAALEMMGWRLARAWSLAWYARPDAEAAKVKAALGAAAPPAPGAVPNAPPAAAPAATPPPPVPGLAEPYREAAPALPEGAALPDIPPATLAAAIAEIVAVEAPITADALAERLRLLTARAALTARDKDAIRQALAEAKARHGVVETAGLLATATTKTLPRDRRAAAAHLRRAAAVPPAEVAAAAHALLAARPGLAEADLAAGVHALLGLDPGAQVAIAARIAALVGAGTLIPSRG